MNEEIMFSANRITVPTFAALVGVALFAHAGAAQRYAFSGQELTVYNLAGTIRVQGSTSGEIVVNMTKHGADAGKLTVETGKVRGHDAFRVIYPSDRIVFRDGHSRWDRTQLHVNSDGTFGDGTEGRQRWGFGSSGGRGMSPGVCPNVQKRAARRLSAS